MFATSMRGLLLVAVCFGSVTVSWAKDEFLLRNLIPTFNTILPQQDPLNDEATLAVLFYSTETKAWLPPLKWASPRNYLTVSLDSAQPHFVRLRYKDQTVDLGYVDFHQLRGKDKQPPILALYIAKTQRPVPAGQRYTLRTVEEYTTEYKIPQPVTENVIREVQGTNPTTGKPADFAVALPIQRTVFESRSKTMSMVREIPQIAPPGTMIDDERLALGVQEFLAVDQESMEPAVKRPPVQLKPDPMPAWQATFRLLQVLPHAETNPANQAPLVWLYSTKDKDWCQPGKLDSQAGSGPLPLNAGLHFLRVEAGTYETDIGYVDFAAVSKEPKEPLFVLETMRERLTVRAGQEYRRVVPSFVETVKAYTINVPVNMTRVVPATDPNTGKTIERTEEYTTMVPEQRTSLQRMTVMKTEKVTAPRDEVIEQVMPRLSFVREAEVDRQQKAPAQAVPAPEPEVLRPRPVPVPAPNAPPAPGQSFAPPGAGPTPSFFAPPAPVGPVPAPAPPAPPAPKLP